MSAWTDRSREEAHLFNPGFLSLLVWSTVAGYREVTGEGLPFELVFVALPLSLHKPTREALPVNPRTSLATWLERNAYFRVGFAERAKGLALFTREAILFASTHGLLAPVEGGRLLSSPRPRTLSPYLRGATEEVRDCVKRAEFVGRWFGTAGTPTTIMDLWGVAP
jgi:hypothetical protein